MTETVWPLRTARLRIRPVHDDDFAAVWSYWSIPAVTRWLGEAHPTEDSLRARFARPEWRAGAFVIAHEGAVVGDLLLRVGDAWAQADAGDGAKGTEAELGWVLSPAAQGRGIAHEAVSALLAHCFDDLGLRRVTANCFTGNEPSWRLMERLGMRREAHNRANSLHTDDGWLDNYCYALLAEEWRSRGGDVTWRG